MPMTTFCEGFPNATNHKVIRELLNELNKIDGQQWECEEFEYKPHFFSRKTNKYYTLYSHVHGIEHQVINFYLDESDWSINPSVSAGHVVAYLHGYLGGLKI